MLAIDQRAVAIKDGQTHVHTSPRIIAAMARPIFFQPGDHAFALLCRLVL
jgi:hypothetical protein